MLIPVFSFRFTLFLMIGVLCIYLSAGNSHIRCIEKEKQALLKFKQGLNDSGNLLSSWKSEVDCCSWRGISCDNQTGHITKVMLDPTKFSSYSKTISGKIDPSLCELKDLTYLDLRYFEFDGQRIPNCIGSLGQLRHLALANDFLNGIVPHEIGNLSNLENLELWANDLTLNDIEWVSHLSSLKYLDLGGVDMSHVIDWLSPLRKIPSLFKLRLGGCGLAPINPKPLFSNVNSSTNLKVLDLGVNYLNSSILSWVFNVSKVLVHLGLSENNLDGFIPDSFANMVFLEHVSFSGNQLVGGIPKSFCHLCHLQELYLDSNNLSGKLVDSLQHLCPKSIQYLYLSDNPFNSEPIPEITRFSSLQILALANTSLEGILPNPFGHLLHLWSLDLSHNNLSGPLPEFIGLPSMLELDLSYNELNGIPPNSLTGLKSLQDLTLSYNKIGLISEAHLSHLSRLSFLDVSHNILSFNFSLNWVPPFQLLSLSVSFCNIGPDFPMWLRSQRKLEILDLSNGGISDSIPEWFWHLSSNFQVLNFSQNKIHGVLPKSLPKYMSFDFLGTVYDLSFNKFSGPLPLFPPNTLALRLSNNLLSGSFTSYCTTPQSALIYLDVSNNLLAGELPDCWEMFKQLKVLNLADNNFSGIIPKSIWFLDHLKTIHLNNNSFSGGIPSSVNCTSLYSIDLGENNLNGNLPAWIGHKLKNLIVLRLRRNKFHGSIPKSLCNLNHLQILDLSQNKMSGKIPDCLNNIDALSNITFPKKIMALEAYGFSIGTFETHSIFIDEATLMWKGEDYEYGKNLGLVTMIDFSCNHLYGEIPSTMTSLWGLVSLNLSRNNLTGFIPNNFGDMKSLESLDLSRNSLFGRIPSSFSNLTWLALLNLSFNNLSGAIPSSTQLQSFEASAYMGNIGLCGPPLKEECPGSQYVQRNHTENVAATDDGDDDNIITFGFYVSLVLGFIIGFWGVCGSLILKSSWRHAYFQFLSNIYDWLFVHVVVFAAKMKRRF